MLVALDQIARARLPGRKPYPNTLSSLVPWMSARKVVRKASAPSSARMPVQRAKTPLRSVQQAGSRVHDGKAHCGDEVRLRRR
jgi:hypothetical protein